MEYNYSISFLTLQFHLLRHWQRAPCLLDSPNLPFLQLYAHSFPNIFYLCLLWSRWLVSGSQWILVALCKDKLISSIVALQEVMPVWWEDIGSIFRRNRCFALAKMMSGHQLCPEGWGRNYQRHQNKLLNSRSRVGWNLPNQKLSWAYAETLI